MQSLNRLTYWLKKKILLLLAIVVLGVALYAVLLDKLVMQELPRFLPEIEQQITQRSGLTISVGEIAGDLHWLSPRVVLSGVRLHHPSKPNEVLFEIPRLTAELNVLSSLVHRKISLGYLQLDDVKLSLHRENGQWQLMGLQPLLDMLKSRQPSDSSNSADQAKPKTLEEKLKHWLPYLYQQRSITFHNWQIAFSGETQYVNQLSDIDVRLLNAGNEHHLGISGRWQDTQSKEHYTKVVLEYSGNPVSREQFSGDAYLHLPTLDMQPFIGDRSVKGFTSKQLTAGGELWLSVQKGELTSVAGDLQVDELKLSREGFAGLVDIADLLGRFDWHKKAGRDDLTISGLGFNYGDARMPASNMFLSMKTAATPNVADQQKVPTKEVEFFVDYLSLSSIADFAAGLPLPEDQLEIVDSLGTQGYLLDVKLQLVLADNIGYQVSAGFNQLGLNAYKKIPGLSGLSGYVEVNNHAGWVDIDVNGPFSISPQTLYSEPLMGKTLTGSAYWEKQADGAVDVKTSFIHLVTEYAQADTLFNIYGIKKGQIPELAVMATIHQADAAAASLYTPDQKVGKGLMSWLDSSIKGGQIEDAGLIINGPARIKPGQYYAKTLQLLFPVKQAQLKFLPDWPSIKNAKANVLIDGKAVHVFDVNGEFLSSQVEASKIELPYPPEENKPPTLLIQGVATGPVEDGLAILQQTNLKKNIPEDILDWQGTGQAVTQFDIELPFTESMVPVVEVKSKISQASLTDPSLKLELQQLKGNIRYHSQDGISASDISGLWLGQAVKANIRTQAKPQSTVVDVEGRMPVESIRQWSNQVALAPMSGVFDYQASLHFMAEKHGSRVNNSYLQVLSDLSGVAIDGPAPLNKTKQQKIPSAFLMTLGGVLQQIDVSYGNRVQLTALTGAAGPVQGRLRFGSKKPEMPAQFGLWVEGDLQHAEFEQWQDFFTALESEQEKLAASSELEEDGVSNVAGSDESSDPWLNALRLQNNKELIDRVEQVSLQIVDLVIFGEQFDDVEMVAHRGVGDWKIYVHNDLLMGDFLIPDEFEVRGQVPIVASLDYLHLPSIEPVREADLVKQNSDEAEVAETPSFDIGPGDIPPLNLTLGSLRVGGEEYGRWSFHSRPDLFNLDSVLFESMDFEFNGVRFQGNAIWRKTENGLANFYNGTAKAVNVRAVMENWGYAVPLETKEVALKMDVRWPGMPWDVGYQSVYGDMHVRIKDGVLTKVDSKTEAIKALGFLSVNNLSRRLKLNFSDLYAEGLELDKIEGNVHLDQGVLSTEKIQIEAPFVEAMGIYGSTDMVAETLNMKMDVTIPVSSSLLPACILGIAVCAGVVVTSTLLKGELDKLTSISYDVSGTWKDPEFKVVKR